MLQSWVACSGSSLIHALSLWCGQRRAAWVEGEVAGKSCWDERRRLQQLQRRKKKTGWV